MDTYEEFLFSKKVEIGDGNYMYAYGRGTMTIDIGSDKIVLEDVWYVPRSRYNILSVLSLTDQQFRVNFVGQYCTVIGESDCEPILSAKKFCKLYCVEVRLNKRSNIVPVANVAVAMPSTSISTSNTTSTSNPHSLSKLWHNRLGHIAQTSLKYMVEKDAVSGLPNFDTLQHVYNQQCEHCLGGAYPAMHHPPTEDKPTEPLQLIYADLTGPFSCTVRVQWLGER